MNTCRVVIILIIQPTTTTMTTIVYYKWPVVLLVGMQIYTTTKST